MTVRGGRPTRTQARILDAIRDYEAAHEDGPSYRDLADAIGVHSLSNIHRQVTHLQRKGFVAFTPRISRSIRTIDPRALTVVLPADLDGAVRATARSAGVPPQAVIIEAVRDACSHLFSISVSRETDKPSRAPSVAAG